MNSKKILIVCHGFYPDQSPRSFRSTELAKEFKRQGHEVTLIATYWQGIEVLLNEYSINYKNLGVLNWNIPSFLDRLGYIGVFLKRIITRVLYSLIEFPDIELFFKVMKALRSEKNEYDLLISIAVPYPIHWGVATVWKKNKKNIAKVWVADCGDPFYLQKNDTFTKPFYFRWIEKWFMKKPNYISVPTDKSYLGYFTEFHQKIKVIPQGYKFNEVKLRDTLNDGIVRFGYGGIFIKGRRDPSEFLDFLCDLPKTYKFEFHVYTKHINYFSTKVLNDGRIFVHDFINRNELLEKFSTFNFVVNFSNPVVEQTPSKLIDYLIIQKPILNIVTGDLNKDNVLMFLNGNYTNQLTIADGEKYKIERVVNQFLDLLK